MMQEKSADVFFVGSIEGSSSIRQRGMAELEGLRRTGLRIDTPSGRLSRAQFYERCAQAWLTWSPEGLGWDCFRHYEAAACWSIPVINQPTIERYAPLRHGQHAIHYEPEPGGLTAAILDALVDKERLACMAKAAHDHALTHHAPAAIARHMVQSTLRAAGSAADASSASQPPTNI